MSKTNITASIDDDMLLLFNNIKAKANLKKTSDVIKYCIREVSKKKQDGLKLPNSIDIGSLKSVNINNKSLSISDGSGFVHIENCSKDVMIAFINLMKDSR